MKKLLAPIGWPQPRRASARCRPAAVASAEVLEVRRLLSGIAALDPLADESGTSQSGTSATGSVTGPIAPAAAQVYYVSPGGSDSSDGDASSPWRTLQHAADQVTAGDTVIVLPGDYVGFDLRTDGTADQPITFQAQPGARITTRNPITPDGINLEGSDYIVIEGFEVIAMPRAGIRSVTNHHVTIRNNRTDQNARWGIFTGFSDDLLIEANITTNSQTEHGIYVSNSGDRPVIRRNIIFGNRAAGIHMNGDLSQGGDGIISGALVEENVIYDNGLGGGSGINADGVQNSRFQNNLLYGNHASGISLYRIDGGGGSSGNVVVNNTIVQAADGRWALNISGGSTNNTVLNNIFYNHHSFRGSISITSDSLAGLMSDYNALMDRMSVNGGGTVISLSQWQSTTGQDAHSILATPEVLFVDASANDYHLRPTSPAIDRGTSLQAPLSDIDGLSRPQGSAVDVGAYEFATQGSRILDDGDSGVNQTGSWFSASGQGYQLDVRFAAAGTGSEVATWSFTGLTPGLYRVSTTWSPHPNRATNAPFTVLDGGTPLGTVPVNQELLPNDFSDAGGMWEDLGFFTLAGTTLNVQLTNSANEYVIADAVRIERITGPEISVSLGGQELSDGQTAPIDFGTTLVGQPVSRTFTVRNVGASTMSLGALSLPSGFSLTEGLPASLAPGAQDSFTVQFDAAAGGTATGTLSLINGDADEDPFNFHLTAAAGTAPIVDDGDAAFSLGTGWSPAAGQGYQSDVQFAAAGNGSAVATWSFAGLTPGLFRIWSTWSPHPNRATNAPYTVFDGAAVEATVLLNQELAPNDLTADGGQWEMLGTFIIDSTSLAVELSNNANEYVIADAVRIERLGDIPAGAEIAVFDGAAELTDGSGTVLFPPTLVGRPVTKTFTVRNVGTSVLTLGTLSVTGDYSLIDGLAASLAPGAEDTFTVQFQATASGTALGSISLASDDADENPFDIALSATPGTVLILDDSQPGFVTTGNWFQWDADGHAGDLLYDDAGTGAETATWTFSNLPVGQYRLWTTWAEHPNRATNAPHTILDGSTHRGTVLVNQELTPGPLNADGSRWTELGLFAVTTNTLSVQLTDNANEWVIADAIRIERVGGLTLAVTEMARPSQSAGNSVAPDASQTAYPSMSLLTASATNEPKPLDSNDSTVIPDEDLDAAFADLEPLSELLLGLLAEVPMV